jgi:hypothetical protein
MAQAGTGRSDCDLAPVKFSRLTRRGVTLGLSASQLVMVGIGAASLVLGLYAGGGSALVAVPVIVVCAVLAWVEVGGRKLIEWLPITGRWLWRSAGGQLIYRRRIVKPRPAGMLALPGDAARLRQWVDPETGAVMVHDPHRATLTAIVGVSHPAFTTRTARRSPPSSVSPIPRSSCSTRVSRNAGWSAGVAFLPRPAAQVGSRRCK